MNIMKIEFDNGVNNSHTEGYLRIPENFNPKWPLGFYRYLEDKYKATNINVYPLNLKIMVNQNTVGYYNCELKNLEDDFILALRSTEYYPKNDYNDNIRRQWATLDPMTQDFTVKER